MHHEVYLRIFDAFILLNNSVHMTAFVTRLHKKRSLPEGRLLFLISTLRNYCGKFRFPKGHRMHCIQNTMRSDDMCILWVQHNSC